MSHALIVVDLQNDFVAKGGYYDRKEKLGSIVGNAVERDDLAEPSKPRAYDLRRPELAPVIDRISAAIMRARQLGWPIAFVLAEYGPDFDSRPGFLVKSPPTRCDYPCKPGTWGAGPIEPMLAHLSSAGQKNGNEIVLRKHTLDGFADTELTDFLSARGVESVCVCGVETDACVLATAIGASRRFVSVILEDCSWTSTANGASALKIFENAFGLVRSWSAAIEQYYRGLRSES